VAEDVSTEDRILDAAHTVFVRKGTQNANLKDIAEQADVNQALLHYYFRNKKTLADTVFERVASDFIPKIQSAFVADQPIPEKVETIVHRYMRLIKQNPYLPVYVVGELNQNPEEMKERLRSMGVAPFDKLDLLDEQLQRAADAGEIRPISAEQFIVNVLSLAIFPFIGRPLLKTVLDMNEDAFETFIDERADTLSDLIMNGLRPT
jgi:AcrR family transcriptional regulator